MNKATIKFVAMSTIGLIAASTLASTAVVSADATGATYNSNGQIQYVPSTDPTSPVDPQDPTVPVKPVDPTDPNGPETGTAGPLSIDFASSFDFGTQNITSKDMTYNAATQKLDDGTDRTNYVQVTDNRGTLAGWSLNVEATDFVDSAATAGTPGATLQGAQITLGDAEIQSASDTPADYSVASTTLTPGVVSPTILGATAGHGAGTNLLDFGGKDGATKDTAVKLAVPGKATKLAGKYTAKLTWTLSDTPAN